MSISVKIQFFLFAYLGLLVASSFALPLEQAATEKISHYKQQQSHASLIPEITDEDVKQEETILFKELCLNLVSASEWTLVRDSLKKFCLSLLIGAETNDLTTDLMNSNNNQQHQRSEYDQFVRPRRFLEIGLGKSNDLINTNKGFKYGK
jgi:hypothetical protein